MACGGWGVGGDDSAVAVLDMSSSLISGRSRLVGGLTTGGGWEEGEHPHNLPGC